VGRHRIIETPEEFDRLVEEFREQCLKDNEPPTLYGLVYHLGFASRQSMYDYGKRPGFKHSVARARLLIKVGYEKRLWGSQPAGAIFWLKAQANWKDKQVMEHTTPDGEPLEVVVTHRVVDAEG
jgi:hypothetical protein